ncbi:MAG: hypothetical protein AABZ10_02160 [Nitrospirota bacterium]
MNTRYYRIFIVLLLLFGIAACGGGGGGGGTTPAAPAPAVTALGVATGAPSSATIGASGGSVAAPDGSITLTIPAGALATDTTITIQPLTSTALGGIGAGYRLMPEAQAFSQPVHMTFTYTDADLINTAAEALGVAFQTSDGHWQWNGDPIVDVAAKTVTVDITHFSDWSLVKGFQIRPPTATVQVGQSVALKVAYCFTPQTIDGMDMGDIAPLGYECAGSTQDLAPLLPVAPVSDWSVNSVAGGNSTVGTVSGSKTSATYHAPAVKPSSNPVAVSARVDAGKKGKVLVVSNITITDKIAYIGNVNFDVTTYDGTSVYMHVVGSANVTWNQYDDLGDVKHYYASPGTATADFYKPNCDPVHATFPIVQGTAPNTTAKLTVYTSTNGGFPNSYSFNLGGSNTTLVPISCGTPRETTLLPIYVLAKLVVGPIGSCTVQNYTDETKLSGSESCTVDPSFTINNASWDFTAQ